MIGIPPGVRILIAMQPVDFRRGADSLAALAKEVLRQDPFSGTVLVFRAKRADRVKVVAWDGSGLVMLWKRLDEGAFKWPPVSDGVMRLSSAQLSALLEGLDLVTGPRAPSAPPVGSTLTCDRLNQTRQISPRWLQDLLYSRHGASIGSPA